MLCSLKAKAFDVESKNVESFLVHVSEFLVVSLDEFDAPLETTTVVP